MTAPKKKTIISEALADYKTITEAATAKAKDELAKELPNKFNKMLGKKVKESIKESFEDGTDDTEDGEIENIDNTIDAEVVDATEFTLDDLETAFDNAGGEDEFEIQPNEDDEIRLSFDAIVDELDKLKGEEEDDFEIEQDETDSEIQPENKNLKQKEMIKQGTDSFGDLENDDYSENVYDIDEADIAAILEGGYDDDDDDDYGIDTSVEDAILAKVGYSKNKQAPIKQLNVDKDVHVDKYDTPETFSDEDEIDENMIQTLSQKKTMGGEFPRGEDDKHRYGLSESKKLDAYIKENQKLMKTLNATKKALTESKGLIGKYENVVSKYRTQLSEMAIFNTNLSNANSLLISEELTLTAVEKASIINEFKSVKSINESEEKYAKLLGDFKDTKRRTTKLVEQKLNQSSTQTAHAVNEVVERTVYNTNEHIDKIKRLMTQDFAK